MFQSKNKNNIQKKKHARFRTALGNVEVNVKIASLMFIFKTGIVLG